MREINKLTLSVDQKKVIYDHEDLYGGCSHELSVYNLLRVLKPVIKKPNKGA